MIVRMIKIAVWLLGAYVLFALVASTLSCALPKSLVEEEKRKIDEMVFTGNPDLPGPDRAMIIESPEDALNVRLEMIRNAAESLDIVMYKIVPSPSVDALMKEIADAANRGVKVRVLIDGKASLTEGRKTGRLLKTLSSHPNISCKSYNPLHLLKPWQWHFMLHDKFMVVDNAYLLLGGRNFDQRHFAPKGFTKPITHDRDVFVVNQAEEGGDGKENPSGITQALLYMEELWNSRYTKAIKAYSLNSGKPQKALAALQNSAAAFENENRQFYQKTLQNYVEQSVETRRTTFIRGEIQPWKKQPLVAYQMKRVGALAVEQVIIQTPYASGTRPVITSLEALSTSAKVEMVTNSQASSPNILAFSNYYGHRKAFINTGVHLYEYQSRNSIHGKSMVVDDYLSAIGSFNVDERSIYINTESLLVFDSPQLSRQLNQAIGNIKTQCLKVGQDNQYIKNPAVEPLPLSPGKKVLFWLVHWLMRPFEFLL